MTRRELDHLLRAAGDLTGHKRFVLVGSNAIFAWYEHVPERMMISREADMFASDVSDDEVERISDLLENIGQLSVFDDTHGYHVDGVGPETAKLPSDWRERCRIYVSPATNGVEAVVPHPEDIAVSKLFAGREKDLDWVSAAHGAGFIDLAEVASRIDKLPELADARRVRILELIEIVRRRGRD
ncbi:MAG: hypothetical protein Q8Q88_06645 [Phenylobacterium sp.]|uniref:DUF6036 family nucleotidyltransferase n=1 Tax=Phenylobacterium sp. TaxID=1871053 RepID=UPI002733BA3D|nr:DUF6036 family nucleotidyltransferase [Phenylobacterium sp.]MDP3746713.1 hypothetical protein [Phenylobacterium sp.]